MRFYGSGRRCSENYEDIVIKFEGHKLINYNMLTNLVRKAEREKKNFIHVELLGS